MNESLGISVQNTCYECMVIAKMYSCPECGWVTECYPDCPVNKEEKNE